MVKDAAAGAAIGAAVGIPVPSRWPCGRRSRRSDCRGRQESEVCAKIQVLSCQARQDARRFPAFSRESNMDLSAIGNSLELALSDAAASHPRCDCNPHHRLDRGNLRPCRDPSAAGCRAIEPSNRRAPRSRSSTSSRASLSAVFWLIILVTLIGVFNSLDLALASGPFEVMVKEIASYVPHLVAGTVLAARRVGRRGRVAGHRQSRARCKRTRRKAFRDGGHAARCARA